MRLFVRKINISNYNLFGGESEKKIVYYAGTHPKSASTPP